VKLQALKLMLNAGVKPAATETSPPISAFSLFHRFQRVFENELANLFSLSHPVGRRGPEMNAREHSRVCILQSCLREAGERTGNPANGAPLVVVKLTKSVAQKPASTSAAAAPRTLWVEG
jgi:hypothetical protein